MLYIVMIIHNSAHEKIRGEWVDLLLEKGADLNKGEQRRSDIHSYQTRYFKEGFDKE